MCASVYSVVQPLRDSHIAIPENRPEHPDFPIYEHLAEQH